MKKLFLVIIAFVGIVSFANNSNIGTGTKTIPADSTISMKIVMTKLPTNKIRIKKGEIVLADSSAYYRASDSTLAHQANGNDLIPTGFTLVEKPR